MVEQLKLLLDAARERVRQAEDAFYEGGEAGVDTRYEILQKSRDLEVELSEAYETAIWLLAKEKAPE